MMFDDEYPIKLIRYELTTFLPEQIYRVRKITAKFSFRRAIKIFFLNLYKNIPYFLVYTTTNKDSRMSLMNSSVSEQTSSTYLAIFLF